MGTLSHLDVSSNNLGSLPDGWEYSRDSQRPGEFYNRPQNKWAKELPAGVQSGGAIIANAIKDMGALTKLDISNNNIEQGGGLKQIIEYCNTKGIELDNHESKERENDELDLGLLF